MRLRHAVLTVILLSSGAAPCAAAQQAPPGTEGRIAGRVVDRETGRPLSGVRITIAGRPLAAATDLDGRYRSDPLAPGTYAVQAAIIGYQPVRIDTVVVRAGEVARADFVLAAAALQIAGVEVQAEAVPRASSAAGLLAIQQAAPTVSDGISAEAMARTPDADAADAIARVTGISVVDNKFVVVRGLPERYSNTLLNGTELVSPEPLRRVVPLDIFPANLLETIVTTKAAAPDRPGDFAGGSVEIRTKDIPDEFVAQASLSQGYNSLATFEHAALVPRGGTDFFGFDDGRRALPADIPPISDFGPAAERFGESLRNVWTPAPRWVAPDLGASFNVAGRSHSVSLPVGFVASWTYSRKTEVVPDRVFRLYSDPTAQPSRSLIYQEGRALVDWGAIANASVQFGTGGKVSWRNLYTRGAEEAVIQDAGFDTENSRVVRQYQVAYFEQDLLQSQLAGEHSLAIPRSRFEWRATWARANRDEPDNRQVDYVLDESSGEFAQASQVPTRVWARFLDDRLAAYQADWAFPIGLRRPGDTELKVGALYRTKDREFTANFFRFSVNNLDPNARAISRLPPELAFAPENIGGPLTFSSVDAFAQSYDASERLRAAYVMADLPVLPAVRVVGGVRLEEWRVGMFPGGRRTPDGDPSRPGSTDWLWSGNVTVRLREVMNLRLSGFTSVSRPDFRELSPDSYVPIAGGCENQGNASLRLAKILNGDVRWEVYPRPGELLSVSAFYKRFDRPIIEVVDIPGGGQCRVTYKNGRNATNYGVELEARRALDFLPGALRGLFAGANVTWVASAVTIDSTLGVYDAGLDLQGQSPLVANVNLGWTNERGAVQATLLVNYFADRVARYGTLAGGRQGPNLIERGRATVDAKIQYSLGPRWSLSLSGRNLTNVPVEFIHRVDGVTAVAGSSRPGLGLSLGAGYAR